RKAEAAKRDEQQKKQAQQTAQDVMRKKPQWLADWKTQLINDLNRVHYDGAIIDAANVKYTGIARATPENLVMKVPYGELGLPWNRLPATTLLRISVSFVNPNSADAADREWLSA